MRRMLVGTLAMALLAASASASADELTVTRVTIRTFVRVDTAVITDADHDGVSRGDVFSSTGSLLDANGQTIGRLEAVCIFAEPPSRTCTEIYALHGGKLFIVGTTAFGSAAVVGGTGRFVGATGVLIPGPARADGTIPNTFRVRLVR